MAYQLKRELTNILSILGVKVSGTVSHGLKSLVLEYATRREAEKSYKTVQRMVFQESEHTAGKDQEAAEFTRADIDERLDMLGMCDLNQLSVAS